MSTIIQVRFDEGSPADQIASEAMANRPPDSNSIEYRRFGELKLHWRAGDGWHYKSTDILHELPAELATAPAGIVVEWVQLHKGSAPVDLLSARQGRYLGVGEYRGCSAVVDNRVNNNTGADLQTVDVEGPPENVFRYYAAVRARRVYPRVWHQPQPWWARLPFIGRWMTR